jgi:hypothetical protein
MSQADRRLIEVAAREGVRISEHQLRRWRQAGEIPRPTRRWLGRGRGSASTYPAGTAERLVAVARAYHHHHSRPKARLALFGVGHPLPEDLIKEAYRDTLAPLRLPVEALRREDPGDQSEAAWEAVSELVAPFMRTLLGQAFARRLARHAPEGEGAANVVWSVFTTAVQVLPGGPLYPSAVQEVLDAVDARGIHQALSRHAGTQKPATTSVGLEGFTNLLGLFRLEALEVAVAQASLAQLEAARDHAALLVAEATAPFVHLSPRQRKARGLDWLPHSGGLDAALWAAFLLVLARHEAESPGSTAAHLGMPPEPSWEASRRGESLPSCPPRPGAAIGMRRSLDPDGGYTETARSDAESG